MADISFTLGDGRKMPAVGFGTFMISPDVTKEAVSTALKTGYRHIDTAEFYFNEKGVGEAIRDSGLARDDIFITTKVWPGDTPPKKYDDVVRTCKDSIENLGVQSVDLYLIHAAFAGSKDARVEQWRAVVECQKMGLCKSIGVSNWDICHLQELEEAGLPTPAANQLELHPHTQKRDLLEYMKAKHIHPIAYSSMAPLSTWRANYDRFGGSKTEEDRGTTTPASVIAERLGVPEACVLLKYGIQKGWSILPKSTQEARIRANFDLFSFELTELDMAELDGMECGRSYAFGAPGEPVDPTKCK